MLITTLANEKQRNYAIYDNYRKISSFIDGFKSSSRKAFYCIDKFKKVTKVDTIASIVSVETQYLHGTVSLEGVIKGMTSNYCGSNNINLFSGEGFFGNRTTPEAGASRYVKAKKNDISDLLFKKEDNDILIKQEFEGYKIEPKFYVPIIPMVFINGSIGLGNGFSQTVYGRKPKEIIQFIKNKLTEKNRNFKLLPYFKGFKGNIKRIEENRYLVSGKFEKVNLTTILIKEIPINISVDKYISILNSLEDKNVIKDYIDKCDKDEILFEIKCSREIGKLTDEEILKIFKLESFISENLTFMDENNSIIEFTNIEQALYRYIDIRLEYYVKRKEFQLKEIKNKIELLQNKIKFINQINSKEIILYNKTKDQLEKDLNDFKKYDNSFDYLLNMKIYNMTDDKLNQLRKELGNLNDELTTLQNMGSKDIWLNELDQLDKLE